MCGRFTRITDIGEIAEEFGAEPLPSPLPPGYNIAPGDEVAAVVRGETTRLALFRWGLIPSWAKDPAIAYRMINARAETLAEKPSFRVPLAKRRCLIAADGFYEWRAEGKRKVPMYVRLRSGKPFAFAGLHESWTPPGGDIVRTCTIITTEPNDLVRQIHNRMPVILSPPDRALWLDPSCVDKDLLLPLLRPYEAEEMEAYEVSPAVNSPRHKTPDCIAPAGGSPPQGRGG